jgi:aminocarboxymuconate-semialdehyde decarboxylase
MSPVIDVHTHMLTESYVRALATHGGRRLSIGTVVGGQKAIHMDGAPFMTLMPGMFDYKMRIAAMDQARVDLAVVSLTCPNVYWGGREVSRRTAAGVNDDMAEQQSRYPDRIRWFASLPWQYPKDAVAELRRARSKGAIGVMVLANIANRPLIDPKFAPIWRAIEAAGLPVLVHPTAPPGVRAMDMQRYNLIASIGFMFDTTLAFTRMIYDGFFDRYPRLKVIASHAGATLPYLSGRLDRCHDMMPACRVATETRPSRFLRRIYVDSVTYTPEALQHAIAVGGIDRMMYGSDYPHNIGDMRGCLARVEALPKRLRDAVRGGNAMRIFGL